MENRYMDVEVDKLQPHPENDKIYGNDEDVSDLKDQIAAYGKIIERLKIKSDYVIISGHRRWKAAMELGHKSVPCEIVSFISHEEELACLVMYNYKRAKTNVQKAREGIALEETLSDEAVKRRMMNLKQHSTDMEENSISEESTDHLYHQDSDLGLEVGLTRDKVAKVVGFTSGRMFDYAKNVLNKIDQLKNEGNERDSDLFVTVLNRAPSTADKLLNVELDKLSDDEIESIRTGENSPSKYLPKTEQSRKNIVPYKKNHKRVYKSQ